MILDFLYSLVIAGAIPVSSPASALPEILQPQEVRTLPGQLDRVPVFNSNSPELVLQEGILLSTFPPIGKTHPKAHLNFPLQGRFDVFAHHVTKAPTPEDLRTLYLGIVLYNPGDRPVKIDILQAASYLSQPDAPFIELPGHLENPDGKIYAGPGSRVMNDILRGYRQNIFPEGLSILPRQSRMLTCLPIPVRELEPPINGRSTYLRLHADGAIHAASLAMFARVDSFGNERAPTLTDWLRLLETGDLAKPRDRAPTLPGASGNIIYGRVAGVALGSKWKADLLDSNQTLNLTIPARGEAFSYGLSTVVGGRLGSDRAQSAPMLVRYPDTAYQAHGNYGVHYSLTLPLYNPTDKTQTVSVSIQTPIKQDIVSQGLRFFLVPPNSVFFRGTVRVRYVDGEGLSRTHYFHLVQRRAREEKPLLTLPMSPRERRVVEIDYLYPPDSTPPQVLTVKTLAD